MVLREFHSNLGAGVELQRQLDNVSRLQLVLEID
jgi:hypothetical protein